MLAGKDNFPLEIDSSGDTLTDDYENALIKTRKWFNENANTYEIKTSRY